jgi:hypothetical protein
LSKNHSQHTILEFGTDILEIDRSGQDEGATRNGRNGRNVVLSCVQLFHLGLDFPLPRSISHT